MHSSMHIWHIAMQASSIAIIVAGVMPCIRIIERIIVLHMSAQFMQAGEQSIICVEHTVHACSHAEHASMQACMADMSIAAMSGIDIFDIASIIIESISHRLLIGNSGQEHPPDARLDPDALRVDARFAFSRLPALVNPVAGLAGVCERGLSTRSTDERKRR